MKRALVAIVALLISVPAAAQNFYVYGAFGLKSNFHIEKSERDAVSAGFFGNAPEESMLTSEGGAGKLQFGYQIAKRIALEAGAVDLGRANYFSRFTQRIPPSIIRVSTQQEEWAARGYNLAAVGNIPLGGGFSLLGKAGAVRATMHYKRSTDLNGTLSSEDVSATTWAPNYGLGVLYELPGSIPIALRLEYERVRNIGSDATAGKRDIDMTSFGVVFKF